jgi:hypothetical protein
MLTEYTITDADIGAVLSITNGFLVNLSRTASPPPGYEIPDYDPGRQVWKNARLVLRGSGDIKDLVCIDTQNGGGWASHGPGGHAIVPASGHCTPLALDAWRICPAPLSLASAGPFFGDAGLHCAHAN